NVRIPNGVDRYPLVGMTTARDVPRHDAKHFARARGTFRAVTRNVSCVIDDSFVMFAHDALDVPCLARAPLDDRHLRDVRGSIGRTRRKRDDVAPSRRSEKRRECTSPSQRVEVDTRQHDTPNRDAPRASDRHAPRTTRVAPMQHMQGEKMRAPLYARAPT